MSDNFSTAAEGEVHSHLASPMPDDTNMGSGETDPFKKGAKTVLKSTEVQQLVDSVMQDFQDWKNARSRLEKTWQECWEGYLCDVKSLYTQPDEQTNFRSRIARPVLYESVEAIHAFLLNILLPADEQFFAVLGKTEADQAQAGIIEEFLRRKLQQTGFYEKYGLFLKQAIIIGNSVAAVPWRRKTRKCRVYRPINLFGVTVGKEKVDAEAVVSEGPDFEVLDMFDFLIDPNEPDFERAKVIRRVDRSLTELQRNPVYQNLEGLVPQVSAEDSRKVSKRQAFGIASAGLDQSNSRKQNITLYEAWGDFIIGDKVFQNYVCVVANGNRLIRFEPNPYDSGLKPFIFSTLIPIPNEVYGVGAIEKSLGLQHAINTLTNQKLDVINISINNPFTYLINDDVFDPDTVVTRPGALIPVKSHDTLRPIQYLNNFTVAFNEIADLKEEINQATGAFKFLTGDTTADSGRTATEISALVSGGHQKFSSFTQHLENTSLEPVLEIIYAHAKQFFSQSEIFRMSTDQCDSEFVEILPEIIRSTDCQFKIVGSEATLMKSQELSALLEFARLVQSEPRLALQVDVLELYKKIYRRLGFRDEAAMFHPASPDTMMQQPSGGNDHGII